MRKTNKEIKEEEWEKECTEVVDTFVDALAKRLLEFGHPSVNYDKAYYKFVGSIKSLLSKQRKEAIKDVEDAYSEGFKDGIKMVRGELK